MKRLITAILLTIFIPGYSQETHTITPIKTIERIFKNYIKYDESVDSDDSKEAMKKALLYLQSHVAKEDLPILLNVWMYYDPTDFAVRDFIDPIFKKHKAWAVNAINNRSKHKRKWEDKNKAPFSELVYLKANLLK